jgi:penicillin-binding protein 1A
MTWLDDDEPRLIDQIPPWVRASGRLALRFALIALFLVAMTAVFYWITASRYDLSKVKSMPERTLLLDRSGRELAALHGERRRKITYQDIPPHLIRALMTREDKQFREHGGVHLRGVARAAFRNLLAGEMSQGASTLTMQLARNTFELRADSLHRKFLETALAFRIEGQFSKNEILTAYLNRIYFGSGAYGIGQAARTYFGKEVEDLTVPEAALLVGIIRAPHDFSPYNDREAALRERNDVLANMVTDGYLSQQQSADYQKATLHLMPERSSQTDAIRCARRHLNELLDHSDFATGGLTATSTIDSLLQKAAREGLEQILESHPGLQAGLVAIDPKTGAMRATITARDPKSSQFNRAFDIHRQLGPVFQPFLYAFSAERGRLPIPEQPIQTARQLPDGEVARLAKRLGFHGPFTSGDELARGNLQATPLEVATALIPLATGGETATTFLISKLVDSEGKILFEHQIDRRPVLDSLAAEAPLDITGQSTWAALNNPGTDLWTLHASPDLTAALWLGHDDPKTLTKTSTLAQQTQAFLQTLARIARNESEALDETSD